MDDLEGMFFSGASKSADSEKSDSGQGKGNDKEGNDEVRKALKKTFAEVDEKYLKEYGEDNPTCGSCGSSIPQRVQTPHFLF